MRKRTLYWILAALFAASAIYAPFDDNRDSGLPLTIVTIIALVALAVGFAMAARKVDPEARFKKKPKSVTKMKSKPVKAKDLMVDNYTSIDLETTGQTVQPAHQPTTSAARGDHTSQWTHRRRSAQPADRRPSAPGLHQIHRERHPHRPQHQRIRRRLPPRQHHQTRHETHRQQNHRHPATGPRPLPRRAETPPCRHHPPIRHRTNGKPSRGRRRTPNRTMLRNHESLHEGQRNQITLIQEQNRPGARRVTGAVSCLGLDPPDTGFIA